MWYLDSYKVKCLNTVYMLNADSWMFQSTIPSSCNLVTSPPAAVMTWTSLSAASRSLRAFVLLDPLGATPLIISLALSAVKFTKPIPPPTPRALREREVDGVVEVERRLRAPLDGVVESKSALELVLERLDIFRRWAGVNDRRFWIEDGIMPAWDMLGESEALFLPRCVSAPREMARRARFEVRWRRRKDGEGEAEGARSRMLRGVVSERGSR
jgi:hypothetical protein